MNIKQDSTFSAEVIAFGTRKASFKFDVFARRRDSGSRRIYFGGKIVYFFLNFLGKPVFNKRTKNRLLVC